MDKHHWLPPEKRVVVTGLGAITPNGLSMTATWENVRCGRSGIGCINLFDTSDFRVKIAGEAWGFDALDYLSLRDARRADRNVQFALVASDEAVRQSGFVIDAHNADEVGVYIGSGAGGVWTYVRQQEVMNARGPGAVNPLLIPMLVVNSAAQQVGIRLGARGPNLGLASACATSIDAIGMALETIRRGDALAMIAGGSEAAISELGVAGFDRLNALSRRNDDPPGASRPFDSARDGFVLSEGGVAMVLESLAYARKREAVPLAEVRSYAATFEGLHFVTPDKTGASAARCMTRALSKAHLAPEEVHYISAHATGTSVGDPIEAAAIKAAFGDHASSLAVSSTKSTTGHLLGAAGALATGLTIRALSEGCLPPTINLTDPDPACDLAHIANVARAVDARVALVPSYGFGGHNSCLVVARWDES